MFHEIKTHLDEQKITDLHKAGVFVDDYELTHKKFVAGARTQSHRWSGVQKASPWSSLVVARARRGPDPAPASLQVKVLNVLLSC